MNNVNSQKGRKQSKLRQRQAQITATMIADAARSLFLEQGYTGTTIEAIAGRAEVAVSTVYAVFGSKRGILRAIRAAWHERTHIRDVTYGEQGDTSPFERIRLLAQGTRRQWELGSEVIAIYNSAAAADPEAAAELNQALEGRRKGMQHFAAGLEPHLRPGLNPTRAADILMALCMPELYIQLVHRSAWTPDEYQAWITTTLLRELLGEP